MLIKNYGLFWSRDLVFWGRPNVAGAILGTTRKKDAREVDFREQKAIYVLHKNDRIAYVGQTGAGDDGLFARLRHHTRNHLASRWDQFSWFGLQPVTKKSYEISFAGNNKHLTNSEALNHLEAILLSVIEPPLNKQGARWGAGVDQYYQVPHQELDYTNRELLEAVFKNMVKDE